MARDDEKVLLLVVIGVLLIAAGGYMEVVRQGVEGDYESVDAEIESSEVAEAQGFGGVATTYGPHITYSYEYEGENYTSSTICSAAYTYMGEVMGCTTGGDRAGVEEIVEDHPEGDQVTAYVNPDDPSSAFLLQRSYPLLNVLVIGIGVVFVAAAESEWTDDPTAELINEQHYTYYGDYGEDAHEPPLWDKLNAWFDDLMKVVITGLFILFMLRVFGI